MLKMVEMDAEESRSMITRGMLSRRPARNWEEAFPGGNGTIGVLALGNSVNERIIVNHEELFLPMHGRVRMPKMAEHLPRIRRLIREGRCRDAAAHFASECAKQGVKGMGPDYFHPAFDITVSMPPNGAVSQTRRQLDFENGEIISSWCDGAGRLERRLFVSRPDQAIVMVIRALDGLLPEVRLALAESGMGTDEERRVMDEYLQLVESSASAEGLAYRCRYRKGGGYVGASRVAVTGGDLVAGADAISVTGAKEILILTGVAPQLEVADLQGHLTGLPDDYETLFERHRREHSELFNRVRFSLGDASAQALTNEELLAQAKDGGMPPALAVRMHDLGRYLLISSAGKLPPNAQGLWNGSWKISNLVDYVTNIELEMAVWPALPGGLPECLAGYFDFIESKLPDWRENAETLYGCRGVLASSRSSNHGQLHHFSEEYPHAFWTAGAGWMAQTFYEHWLFTGDEEFLLTHTLPLLKEVALFYEDFLISDSDGRLQFIPSVSPENNPGNSNSQAARNATMDIAVAKEVLTNLLAICEERGLEADQLERWQNLLKRLPEYPVNTDGALGEWAAPELEEHLPHRHLSHLYPAMPGFEAEDDPALALACRKALEGRLENGLLRRCGWSLGHAVGVAARLKDGELVHKFLSEIATNFVSPNLFTLLDHDLGMFQVDANLGFAAAVMEALVFSLPGRVELLPALPSEWRTGSMRGIRCRGGITVTELKWNLDSGEVSATFLSATDQRVELKISGVSHGQIDLTASEPFSLGWRQ
jgi:alpha-L-fucosidase 2